MCCTNEDIAAADHSEGEEVSHQSEEKEEEDPMERQQRIIEEEKMELHMRGEEAQTEDDRIRSFIEEYVALHHITRGYRVGHNQCSTACAGVRYEEED